MSPIIQATAGGGAKVSAGGHHVVCLSTSEDKLENSQFGTGEVIRFTLGVLDEKDADGNDVELDAIANHKLTPSSKLWGWCVAFGVTPEIGKAFDTAVLHGREALAVVIDKANAEGAVFSRVDDIVPLPKGMGGAGKPEPTVILPDGSADLNVFWTQIRAAGLNRKHVTDALGDIEELVKMDGPEVQTFLEELVAKAKGA